MERMLILNFPLPSMIFFASLEFPPADSVNKNKNNVVELFYSLLKTQSL